MADTIDALLDAARNAQREAATEAAERSKKQQAEAERVALDHAIAWAALAERFHTGSQAAVDTEFGAGSATLIVRTDSYKVRGEGDWDLKNKRSRNIASLEATFDVDGPLRDLFGDDIAVRCHVKHFPADLYLPHFEVDIPVRVPRRRLFRSARTDIVGHDTRRIGTLVQLGELTEELAIEP